MKRGRKRRRKRRTTKLSTKWEVNRNGEESQVKAKQSKASQGKAKRD